MAYEQFLASDLHRQSSWHQFIVELGLWDVTSASARFRLRVFYPSSVRSHDTLRFNTRAPRGFCICESQNDAKCLWESELRRQFGVRWQWWSLVNDKILLPLLLLGQVPLPRCLGPRARRTSYLSYETPQRQIYLSLHLVRRCLRQPCRTSECIGGSPRLFWLTFCYYIDVADSRGGGRHAAIFHFCCFAKCSIRVSRRLVGRQPYCKAVSTPATSIVSSSDHRH